MQTFFLAMLLHPDIQHKARHEIDRVVGTGRLPGLADRANLPYVDAVVKESYRWHPIAPMGLAHVSTADDTYEGYLIPKGALVMPNIWSVASCLSLLAAASAKLMQALGYRLFTHDADVYPDPMRFNPDRFMDPSSTPPPDPRDYVFGFGRRVCPGKLLADSSVWLTVALSLAALDIQKPVNQDGHEMTPEVDFMPGVISHSRPFEARIRPRSEQHVQLIHQVEQRYPWDKSSAAAIQAIQIPDEDIRAPY
jgi:cytochrome P450